MADERIYEKKGAYENFYAGSYTPFDSGFGDYFTGHRVPHSEIGAPTSPATANQIGEATKLLNTGMKIVEIGAIQPEVFDAIPKQHFKEIGRLADITDSEITVHGPIAGVDMAGFTDRGWEEEQMRKAERQIISTMEKTYEINPKGNIPVTFHAGMVPIQRRRYIDKEERERLLREYPNTNEEVKKDIRRGIIRDQMLAVNTETGQVQQVLFDESVWPDGKKIFDPKSRVRMINTTEWDNEQHELSQMEELKSRFARMIPAEEYGKIKEELSMVSKGQIEEIKKRINRGIPPSPRETEILGNDQRLQEMEAPLREVNYRQYMKIAHMFNDMQKYPNEFKEYPAKIREKLKAQVQEGVKTIQKIAEGEKKNLREGIYTDKLLNGMRKVMMEMPHAQKWQPGDEFAQGKVAETAANAAFDAWKRFGNKAPTLALENYPDTAISTGEDAKAVVEKSRRKFVEIARKRGISEASAKAAAEKLIGVTWDMGHINMLRRYGFPEKMVTEETKKAAEYIKKLHLTDNFGFEDSHLPPGMGNVPYKKALAELEKAGVKAPHIVEAGGFVQHFKTNPHPYVLEALGSPLYTYMSLPYWNQIRASYGSYFQGYGEFLPDFHFKTYGSSSFSALPAELGGEIPGERRQGFAGQPAE